MGTETNGRLRHCLLSIPKHRRGRVGIHPYAGDPGGQVHLGFRGVWDHLVGGRNVVFHCVQEVGCLGGRVKQDWGTGREMSLFVLNDSPFPSLTLRVFHLSPSSIYVPVRHHCNVALICFAFCIRVAGFINWIELV